MLPRLLMLAMLTGALILNAHPSLGGTSRNETVQQLLSGMKMGKDQMEAMHHDKMSNGKSQLGTHTWIPLKSCNGSLVIYMTRYNRYIGMDTTGDCTMEDVESR